MACTCVYATAENTASVRSGHEAGGYLKMECDECAAARKQPYGVAEFRVVWQACPHVANPRRVIFVEAASAPAATAVAKDHIERSVGISWFTVHSVDPYVRPTCGRVSP